MPTAVEKRAEPEKRSERIDVRLRTADKAIIAKAARVEGLSVSAFMVRIAKLQAEEILRKHQLMKLTPEASLELHHLLFEQTEEPPSALREALALHDQLIESEDL